MKYSVWFIIVQIYQPFTRPHPDEFFEILVKKNNTHCNPPCFGSDFSRYLSFRAALNSPISSEA